MAVPNAPTEATNGGRVHYLSYDLAGSNSPALWRAYFVSTINSTVHGHAGVYVISGTPKTGYKLTAGAAAVAIASTLAVDGCVVKADPDNSEDIWVGASTITTTKAATDGYRLAAGESVGIACRDLATVFIRRGGSVDQGAYYSAQGQS